MIYFDERGNQISYNFIELEDILMPGMAKLKQYRSFDQNQRFYYKEGNTSIYTKEGKNFFTIEFRLLDYEVIESDFMDKIIKD